MTETNQKNILTSKSILVVEDDPDLAKLIQNFLACPDYSVTVQYHGNDIKPVVEKGKFDLIFLDILMPGKNGFDVLKELRSYGPTRDTTIVLLTNLGEIEHIQRGTELGANDYIIKTNITKIKDIADKYLLS